MFTSLQFEKAEVELPPNNSNLLQWALGGSLSIKKNIVIYEQPLRVLIYMIFYTILKIAKTYVGKVGIDEITKDNFALKCIFTMNFHIKIFHQIYFSYIMLKKKRRPDVQNRVYSLFKSGSLWENPLT